MKDASAEKWLERVSPDERTGAVAARTLQSRLGVVLRFLPLAALHYPASKKMPGGRGTCWQPLRVAEDPSRDEIAHRIRAIRGDTDAPVKRMGAVVQDLKKSS
jgi:hypothetical protein